jgi:TRAP-type mannitol/chloroaromatic compound transport system permease small subunit
MRRFLNSVAVRIDRLNGWLGEIVSWLTLGMVVVTFVIVVLRYVFQLNWIWLQESVIYMHALVFMMGAAYTFRDNEHVRVDIFYRGFSERGKAVVNLLGAVILLLPMVLFLFWVSGNYVLDSWALGEGSREAGGLPLVFIMKSYIPLMAGLLFLQGVSSILHSLLTLSRGKD